MARHQAGKQLTVAVVGGSITAGSGVIDGATFTEWLHKTLRGQLGDNVLVQAAAVPGTNSVGIACTACSTYVVTGRGGAKGSPQNTVHH
eukprot:363862-Chlamydomonas_euryale.AAC.2